MEDNMVKIEITNIYFCNEDKSLYVDLFINNKCFEDIGYCMDSFKYQFTEECDGIHSTISRNNFIKLLKK